MTSLITSYIQLLSSLVSYFHKNLTEVDPIAINKARFYSRALSIAFWYINRAELSIREVGVLFKNKFGESNLFSYLIDTSSPEVLSLFDEIKMPIREDELSTIYEQLLSIETSGLEVKSGKEYRNKLGSYYTPQGYAEEITRLTFAEYLKRHRLTDLEKAKIVDFSCGCGAFLLAALNQCIEVGYDKTALKNIACNIYACDVDPLALEIAKISILDFCDASSSYDLISKNFRHSNFLIHTSTEVSIEERLEVSMCGFIYHESLALGVDFLQQYDIVLGNPPWEKIRFEEKKFFSQFIGSIGKINFKFNLNQSIIESLEENPMVQRFANIYKLQLEKIKKQIKTNPFFKDSVIGELNTCSLFADSAYQLLNNDGASGLFVKSSLFTAKANSRLFDKLKNRTIAIYDFINRNKIFDIDSRERFGIIIFGQNYNETIRLGMNMLSLADINSKVEDIQYSIFEVLNPETKMIPNLNSGKDLSILSDLYSSFEIFSKVFSEAKFGRLVHLTNHVRYIDKEPNSNNLPIIEGKFFTIFDNTYSGFNGVPGAERYKSKASSRKFTAEEKAVGVLPESRFFINREKWTELSKQYNNEYMLAWHSLTSATNIRSCVASLMPFAPGSQSVQFLTLPSDKDLIYLTGIFNSIVFDYIIKCKLNGIDLTQAVINQIPIPSIENANGLTIDFEGIKKSAYDIITQIVKSFYSNDASVSQLVSTMDGSMFDKASRNNLFKALEPTVAKLYQLDKSQFEYILTMFDRVYSAKEIAEMLQIFDNMG